MPAAAFHCLFRQDAAIILPDAADLLTCFRRY